MSFEYLFFPEQHLFFRRVIGKTREDAHQQQAEDIEFLAQVEMPVHMLIDARFAEWRPTTLSEMKNVLTPIDSPKLLWLVLIVEAGILQFLISASVQIAIKGGRTKLVSSLEDAIAFLEERDSTLDLSSLLAELEKTYSTATKSSD